MSDKADPPENGGDAVTVGGRREYATWEWVVAGIILFLGLIFLVGNGDNSSPQQTGYSTQSSYAQNNNYGYSESDAEWLKDAGVSPLEARAFEEACGSDCR